MEYWRFVPGYEFLYEVSSAGNIRNFRTGTIRKPALHPTGYFLVDLWRFGSKKTFRVHRLVAMAFLENPGGRAQVNHIDGNKTNNHLENLEWATGSENTRHAITIGHFSNKPLIDSNGTLYESTQEAERKLGIDSSNISKVCRGVYKQYKGMVFHYVQ